MVQKTLEEGPQQYLSKNVVEEESEEEEEEHGFIFEKASMTQLLPGSTPMAPIKVLPQKPPPPPEESESEYEYETEDEDDEESSATGALKTNNYSYEAKAEDALENGANKGRQCSNLNTKFTETISTFLSRLEQFKVQ
jgi:hypothetical protein